MFFFWFITTIRCVDSSIVKESISDFKKGLHVPDYHSGNFVDSGLRKAGGKITETQVNSRELKIGCLKGLNFDLNKLPEDVESEIGGYETEKNSEFESEREL